MTVLEIFARCFALTALTAGIGAFAHWVYKVIRPVFLTVPLEDVPTCRACKRMVIWPDDERVPVWLYCIECKHELFKLKCAVLIGLSAAWIIVCGFYVFVW